MGGLPFQGSLESPLDNSKQRPTQFATQQVAARFSSLSCTFFASGWRFWKWKSIGRFTWKTSPVLGGWSSRTCKWLVINPPIYKPKMAIWKGSHNSDLLRGLTIIMEPLIYMSWDDPPSRGVKRSLRSSFHPRGDEPGLLFWGPSPIRFMWNQHRESKQIQR